MNGWRCVLDQSSLSQLKQLSLHLRILPNPIDFALQFFFWGLPKKFRITKENLLLLDGNLRKLDQL